MTRKFVTVLVAFLLFLTCFSFAFVGVSASVKRTYDFKDSTNNRAYEGTDGSEPPRNLEIGSQMTPTNIAAISSPDGKSAEFNSFSSDYHRFRFKISEPLSTMSKIYVEHYGRGSIRSPGLRLFIWNYATSSWQFLADHSEISSNGVANATISGDISKYVNAEGYLNLLAQAKGSEGSCPFLYVMDGEKYVFVTDLYNRGILAVPGFRPQPEDYAKIGGHQLRPRDGLYTVQITQEYDEISYLDSVALMTVDHSPEVDVFASLLKADAGKMYTVSKTLIPPISATDENGRNILSQILERDGIYTAGAQNELKILNLNLGSLAASKPTKLVISAYTNWDNDEVPKSDEQQNRIGRFIQVRDANGNWVTVFKDFEVIAPAGLRRTYVLDLTGKFLTSDYSVRIGYYPDVRFDYVGIDTSAGREVAVTTLNPAHANLHFRGYSAQSGFPSIPEYYHFTSDSPQGFSHPTGSFTRFGDVLPLLTDRDDKFAILHHGDEISMNFRYIPPEDGVERDFILYSWGYYKGRDYATGATVEPLPFYGMSSYPYPSNESYPLDDDHTKYLEKYNTREYDYQESRMESGGHETIYTDYVKVDVWTVEVSTTSSVALSTTTVPETSSRTSAMVTSSTNVAQANRLTTLVPYLVLVGLVAVSSCTFAIRRIREAKNQRA